MLNNNGTERTIRRITHYVEDYGYTLHPDQPEQDELFEDDDFSGHAPQGVHTPQKAPSRSTSSAPAAASAQSP